MPENRRMRFRTHCATRFSHYSPPTCEARSCLPTATSSRHLKRATSTPSETGATRKTGEGSRSDVRGFGTSNPDLRTSDRAFLACLARHASRVFSLPHPSSASPCPQLIGGQPPTKDASTWLRRDRQLDQTSPGFLEGKGRRGLSCQHPPRYHPQMGFMPDTEHAGLRRKIVKDR